MAHISRYITNAISMAIPNLNCPYCHGELALGSLVYRGARVGRGCNEPTQVNRDVRYAHIECHSIGDERVVTRKTYEVLLSHDIVFTCQSSAEAREHAMRVWKRVRAEDKGSVERTKRVAVRCDGDILWARAVFDQYHHMGEPVEVEPAGNTVLPSGIRPGVPGGSPPINQPALPSPTKPRPEPLTHQPSRLGLSALIFTTDDEPGDDLVIDPDICG